MADQRPPIPVRLAHRPTVGGLVEPWVNIRLADGTVDFRQTTGSNWRRAWSERRCQIDGQPLGGLIAFLGGPNQIAEGGYFDEAGLHPECAAYAMRACPMVAGRMSHYRATPALTQTRRGAVCPTPGCDCDGYIASEQVLHAGGLTVRAATDTGSAAGEPAHDWFAVYARSYQLATTPEGQLLGGVPRDIVRTRQVTRATRDV